MRRSLAVMFAVGLALVATASHALASMPPREACIKFAAPAFNSEPALVREGKSLDCECVSAFLTKRYGAQDATLVLRLLAGGQSREETQKVVDEFGMDTIKAIFAKVGSFESVGRELDQSCPTIAKLNRAGFAGGSKP
jgi:hypothetical protein